MYMGALGPALLAAVCSACQLLSLNFMPDASIAAIDMVPVPAMRSLKSLSASAFLHLAKLKGASS
jgi:hypothetical protein